MKSKFLFVIGEFIILIVISFLIIIFCYGKRNVFFLGDDFSVNIKKMDLSNADLSNLEKTFPILKNFYNLEEVDFGLQTINKDTKDMLEKEYPNIKFNVKAVINFGDILVKEDAEYIDLSKIRLDKNMVNDFKYIYNLKDVNLGNQDISMEQVKELKEKYPNVFFKYNIKLNNEIYASDITKLDLSNQKNVDYNELCDILGFFPKITNVDLSNTNLTNEQMGDLREKYPNIKIDWVVKMGIWSLRTDAKAFSVLITNFPFKPLTTDDIKVLKYCTELEALDLGHQHLDDISVIGDYLLNLRVLILACNQIKDISPLANLKHLHYLELFLNKITDLTPLENLNELVDLNISNNHNLSNIDSILNFPILERLWATNCKISSNNYQKIRDAYPSVKVVSTGLGSTDSGWRTHERYYEMIKMYKNNYISDVFKKYDGLSTKIS